MKRLEGESRTEYKCKICAHLLRGEIDEMLVAGIRHKSILDFASERGLQISASDLSRHKSNHLGNSESQVVAQLESAIRKHLARCLRELKRRDVESLSSGELIANAQAAAEVLAVAFPLQTSQKGKTRS